jgi:hypothetical protein
MEIVMRVVGSFELFWNLFAGYYEESDSYDNNEREDKDKEDKEEFSFVHLTNFEKYKITRKLFAARMANAAKLKTVNEHEHD